MAATQGGATHMFLVLRPLGKLLKLSGPYVFSGTSCGKVELAGQTLDEDADNLFENARISRLLTLSTGEQPLYREQDCCSRGIDTICRHQTRVKQFSDILHSSFTILDTDTCVL